MAHDDEDGGDAGDPGGCGGGGGGALLVEQYASEVLDLSGQYGSEISFSYAAVNCLGKPTRFPSYGEREMDTLWIS